MRELLYFIVGKKTAAGSQEKCANCFILSSKKKTATGVASHPEGWRTGKARHAMSGVLSRDAGCDSPAEVEETMQAFRQQDDRVRGLAAALHASQAECRDVAAELDALRAGHAAALGARDLVEAQLRKEANDATHNYDEAMVRTRAAAKLLSGMASADIPEERLLLTSYELFRQWAQLHEHFKSMQ